MPAPDVHWIPNAVDEFAFRTGFLDDGVGHLLRVASKVYSPTSGDRRGPTGRVADLSNPLLR
jgi:hypothetical protein